MPTLAWLRVAIAVFLAAIAGLSSAKCELQTMTLPVTMIGRQPVVSTHLNGVEARLILDSGAFFNEIRSSAKASFNLDSLPLPEGYFQRGIGGSEETSRFRAKRFGLEGGEIPNVEFLTTTSEFLAGAVGVLGQNFLDSFDIDYDLANRRVGVVIPSSDCKRVNLAYWAGAKPLVILEMQGSRLRRMQHTIAAATVNGIEMRVMFDTGAATSMMSLDAAKRAGLSPGDADVTPSADTRGFGPRRVKTWIAPLRSFVIGTETLANTRVRIGDFDLDDADMLLGVDFILAHHIYVANSQGLVYLTYNGGRVFVPSALHDEGPPADGSQLPPN